MFMYPGKHREMSPKAHLRRAPDKNPMGEVKRCGLLNESRERADGYVIKTLPSYKHDLWNPKDFEQAKMALRFLDTEIQPMEEDSGVVGGRMMGDRANVSLARSWLKRYLKCQAEDVDAGTRADLDLSSKLHLINVHRGCLTHFSTAAKGAHSRICGTVLRLRRIQSSHR
jgi:hypothetical protein